MPGRRHLPALLPGPHFLLRTPFSHSGRMVIANTRWALFQGGKDSEPRRWIECRCAAMLFTARGHVGLARRPRPASRIGGPRASSVPRRDVSPSFGAGRQVSGRSPLRSRDITGLSIGVRLVLIRPSRCPAQAGSTPVESGRPVLGDRPVDGLIPALNCSTLRSLVPATGVVVLQGTGAASLRVSDRTLPACLPDVRAT